MTIQWNLKKVPIKSLKDNPKNPRSLSKDQAEHLQTSLENFGVCEPIVINTDGMIIGGHQRVKILKKMKVKEVDVYCPDRDLTDRESDELNIRLNKNTGEFDFDILANEWDITSLLDWGFDTKEFGGYGDVQEEEISLPDEEKLLKQMTFTLSNDQAETLERAIKISKSMGDFVETGNENSNGNALCRIAEMWISSHG